MLFDTNLSTTSTIVLLIVIGVPLFIGVGLTGSVIYYKSRPTIQFKTTTGTTTTTKKAAQQPGYLVFQTVWNTIIFIGALFMCINALQGDIRRDRLILYCVYGVCSGLSAVVNGRKLYGLHKKRKEEK
jgi:hypothetical protein